MNGKQSFGKQKNKANRQYFLSATTLSRNTLFIVS